MVDERVGGQIPVPTAGTVQPVALAQLALQARVQAGRVRVATQLEEVPRIWAEHGPRAVRRHAELGSVLPKPFTAAALLRAVQDAVRG